MRIALIGGGNMASAIIAGLSKHGFSSEAVAVCDPHPEKRQQLVTQYGIQAHACVGDWLGSADVVILAVKPQKLEECARGLQPWLAATAVVLSIAAGVQLQALRRWLQTDRVIRAMPNTPAMVGAGMTGLYADDAVNGTDRAMVQQIMQCVGRVLWVGTEEDLHTVTAGPGSGPAYVFYFMQALEQALAGQGLTPQQAHEFALCTVEGAAELARHSQEDFAVLRARVTSKGGTTAKAIESFEKNNLTGIVEQAVQACIERSRQMSEQYR